MCPDPCYLPHTHNAGRCRCRPSGPAWRVCPSLFLLSQDLGRSVCVWMICLSLFFIGSGEKDILSLSWWSFGGEHLFVCKSRSLLYPLVINIVAVTVCFSSHWCFQVNFS